MLYLHLHLAPPEFLKLDMHSQAEDPNPLFISLNHISIPLRYQRLFQPTLPPLTHSQTSLEYEYDPISLHIHLEWPDTTNPVTVLIRPLSAAGQDLLATHDSPGIMTKIHSIPPYLQNAY